MEGLRRQLLARKIPGKAIELILYSWREKTNSNYISSWKKWEEWCRNRSVRPFSADIQSVLEFLTVQFEEYRSLKCYRSVKGFPVGQHPLVCRLLKGVFNLRPPCPRYAVTWEVMHILACVRSWGDNMKLDRNMS